jgi:nicotinic acid mononucleotide adenylyltransferase
MPKKAVITYGRFNPPTVGHEVMFKKIINTARANGADAFIIVSHSQNTKKNPLSPQEKMNVIRNMVPANVKVLQTTKAEYGPQFIIDRLRKEGNYTEFKMVLGSNRIKKGNFKWLKINLVSGGNRVNSGNGPASMSATKARKRAQAGQSSKFKMAMSSKVPSPKARSIESRIRSRMGARSRSPNASPPSSK